MRTLPLSNSVLMGLAVIAATASSAGAQVALDKLDRCEDIASVYKQLRAHPASSGECRAPRGELERALVTKLATPSEACILANAPAPFVEGFSCVRWLSGGDSQARDVTCMRAARMEDVQAFQARDSEDRARAASRYLAASEACSISAGQSLAAPAGLLPPAAALLGRFQVGFNSLLGQRGTRESAMFHGYIEVDPSLRIKANAIEVVSLVVNSTATRIEPIERREVGAWQIEVDDLASVVREANAANRKSNIPARLSMSGIALKREGQHGMSFSDKLDLLKSLADTMSEVLQARDFDEIPESDIVAMTGMDKGEIIAQLRGRVPYGSRDRHPVEFSGDIRMFASETTGSCARGGQGLLMAYVVATEPVDGKARDFGALSLGVSRVGACATNSYALTLSTRLIDDALKAVRDELLAK